MQKTCLSFTFWARWGKANSSEKKEKPFLWTGGGHSNACWLPACSFQSRADLIRCWPFLFCQETIWNPLERFGVTFDCTHHCPQIHFCFKSVAPLLSPTLVGNSWQFPSKGIFTKWIVCHHHLQKWSCFVKNNGSLWTVWRWTISPKTIARFLQSWALQFLLMMLNGTPMQLPIFQASLFFPCSEEEDG